MSLAKAVQVYADANDTTIQGLIEIMMKVVQMMADLEERVELLEQNSNEYSEVEFMKTHDKMLAMLRAAVKDAKSDKYEKL